MDRISLCFGYIYDMKRIKRYLFAPLLCLSLVSFAQDSCEILQKMNPDGSKYYFIGATRFFWTTEKQLKGGVITDEENYFLSLMPWPFPAKPAGSKIKGDLNLTLANGQSYILEHYDSRYMEADTVLMITYLIGKKQLDDFLKFDIEQASVIMEKGTEPRIYNFRLHKSAVREQLACFIDQRKRKKI